VTRAAHCRQLEARLGFLHLFGRRPIALEDVEHRIGRQLELSERVPRPRYDREAERADVFVRSLSAARLRRGLPVVDERLGEPRVRDPEIREPSIWSAAASGCFRPTVGQTIVSRGSWTRSSYTSRFSAGSVTRGIGARVIGLPRGTSVKYFAIQAFVCLTSKSPTTVSVALFGA
jgi:hypothetical protein